MTASDFDSMVAIDFESFYDAKYSLRTMSSWNYVHDDRFDAYLVAAHGKDLHWVGHPSKFDWTLIHDTWVLAHNASFDELVFIRLKELGVVPASVTPKGWICTADMVAYLGCKRDLKTATMELLQRDASKEVRNAMRGRTYADAVSAGMEDDLIAYGGTDAVNCYDLAVAYLDQWPEDERELSRLNREASFFGVALDIEKIEAGLESLKQQQFDTLKLLPWIDDGEKPLSPHAIRAQGRKDGVPVPASTAKTDPEFEAVVRTHGDKYPWLKAVSTLRSINTHLARVEALAANRRSDDTMAYQMKYFGAGTGRMSGGGDSGGKFNLCNPPREAMFGVDVRPMIVARPGHSLIISDYAQIEARGLLWVVNDIEMVDLINEYGNLYVAYARKVAGIKIEKGTRDYNYYKAAVLGLGYYCGADRFQAQAQAQYGLELSPQLAQDAVDQYRGSNPKIVQHWYSHQKYLNQSAGHKDDTHVIELASGRRISYWEPRFRGRDVYACYAKGAHKQKLHAGVLTNNEIQGMCRDILKDAWLAMDGANIRTLWTVYDEFVNEVPDSKVDDAKAEIRHLMISSSPWAKGMPIDVEQTVSKHYLK